MHTQLGNSWTFRKDGTEASVAAVCQAQQFERWLVFIHAENSGSWVLIRSIANSSGPEISAIPSEFAWRAAHHTPESFSERTLGLIADRPGDPCNWQGRGPDAVGGDQDATSRQIFNGRDADLSFEPLWENSSGHAGLISEFLDSPRVL